MTALEFLKLCDNGRIVSSDDLTELQIAEAQANKCFFVDEETGYGWAILPWSLRTENDMERDGFITEAFTNEEDKKQNVLKEVEVKKTLVEAAVDAFRDRAKPLEDRAKTVSNDRAKRIDDRTKLSDDRAKICRIISRMLDNPDETGIYPTATCYTELEILLNEVQIQAVGWTWAYACRMLDRDEEPRTHEIPRLVEDAQLDLR